MAGTKADAGGATGEKPTLLLVDGYGLIFRAYHAMPPSLTTSKGEQTNAVYGFAMMLLDVLRREQPDFAVIALEGGPTFREQEFADYKAHRAPMPDDLRSQVARVESLIAALNIPIERVDGYEADDVIGTLSKRCSDSGDYRVVIVTGDSDLLQLVDDNVSVVLPGAQRFGEIRTFDTEAVRARYGFGPEHVADYKALVGDTSDNIPGVPGIGDKTAKNLITQFGGVEEIIAHADEITPTRAKNAIAENTEAARQSLRLATIVRDLPVTLDVERSAVGNYQREQVAEIFRELEFSPSLLAKLPEAQVAAPPTEAKPRPPSKRAMVHSADDLAALVARVREVGEYAVDVETDSLDPLTARLVGIAIGVGPAEGYYIPLAHNHANVEVPPEEVRAALLPILTDPAIKGYAHHAKYDLEVLRQHGYDFTNLEFETMLAAYVLGLSSVGLKQLAFTRLGREMTEIESLIGTGKSQLTMNLVDTATAADYAAGDVEATFELVGSLRPEIEQEGMGHLLHDVEQPLVPILVEMERAGIAIDVAYLKDLGQEITGRIKSLEKEIHALAGKEFSIGSPKQMATLLFEDLKLPSGRKTKTGYSVDADVLESLRDKHPVIELILEHRTLTKLLSTYVEALPQQVNPNTGRVHTSYNQTVAATGRLSSTNPNLQNIPIRSEVGRRVRRAFVADHRPEHRLFEEAILLSADYSQIELRLLAHLSGEPFLIDAFRNGEDIHRATAAVVYGIPLDQVTSDQRRVAKTVNFGVLYGMQAFGLSRDSGLPRAEAQKFIDDYWARLPKVREFFDETLRFGATHGYVVDELGRRRYLPDLTSGNGMRRMAAERQATNAPLQGGAADIMKLAMIALDPALRESGLRARILLQVHDELVLELDRRDLDPTVALVRETMQDVVELKVPLLVEVGIGENWAEMEDLPV